MSPPTYDRSDPPHDRYAGEVRGHRAEAVGAVRRFVRAGDAVVHLSRSGPSGPGPFEPVVFLHSLGTDHRIWDAVAARLPGRATIRLDLPGHGLSDAPREPTTIADLASVVLATLDVEGVRRATIAGLSLGGQIGLRLALDAPERIAALVAMDSGAKLGTEADWNHRIETTLRDGMEAAAPEIFARWFHPEFASREPATAHGIRTLLARTPAVGYAACCRALRDEDLRSRLREVTAPTLVLCGDADRSTPPHEVRAFAAAIPGARYEEIAGAGHQICVERPEAVADAVDRFLGALGPEA